MLAIVWVGVGESGVCRGTEKPDRELLDALGLCGALVRECGCRKLGRGR